MRTTWRPGRFEEMRKPGNKQIQENVSSGGSGIIGDARKFPRKFGNFQRSGARRRLRRRKNGIEAPFPLMICKHVGVSRIPRIRLVVTFPVYDWKFTRFRFYWRASTWWGAAEQLLDTMSQLKSLAPVCRSISLHAKHTVKFFVLSVSNVMPPPAFLRSCLVITSVSVTNNFDVYGTGSNQHILLVHTLHT